MNREFLINIALLILVNLLIKPVYLFGIDRTVQNTVPPGDYGIYFVLLNFTLLFQIVNDFGIQAFNNRNIARHHGLLGKYFPNILILKGLLALVYFLLVFAFALLWGYGPGYYHLLCWLAVNQVLVSLVLFLRSNVSGLAMYRLDSLLSVLDKLLLILLCGYLLLTLDVFRIEWFVYAQTTSLLLTAGIVFALVRARTGPLRFRFRPAFLGVLLRQSYPYALAVFLMTVYTRVDGVMIERLHPDGAYEADVYASAYRLLDAANMIGFLFAGLLLPMFARLLKDRDPVAPLVNFSFQLLWAGAGSLAAATIFFREAIMVALYTHGSAYSGNVLGLLILSFLAVCGIYIYGSLLTAHGSLRSMNRIFAAGVALNIALNAWLIPRYGALGAAGATCATQFLVFALEWRLARRELNLGPQGAVVLRLAVFLPGATAISYLLWQGPAAWPWPYRYALALAGALLLALPLRLIDLGQLTAMLRRGAPPGN